MSFSQRISPVLFNSWIPGPASASFSPSSFKICINLTDLFENLHQICYIFIWKFALYCYTSVWKFASHICIFILSHSTLLIAVPVFCHSSCWKCWIVKFSNWKRKNHKICTQTYPFCKTLLSPLVPELNNDIICWYDSLFIFHNKSVLFICDPMYLKVLKRWF